MDETEELPPLPSLPVDDAEVDEQQQQLPPPSIPSRIRPPKPTESVAPRAVELPSMAPPSRPPKPMGAVPIPTSVSPYDDWSEEQLRAECVRRGLKALGPKDVLLDRLDAFDTATAQNPQILAGSPGSPAMGTGGGTTGPSPRAAAPSKLGKEPRSSSSKSDIGFGRQSQRSKESSVPASTPLEILLKERSGQILALLSQLLRAKELVPFLYQGEVLGAARLPSSPPSKKVNETWAAVLRKCNISDPLEDLPLFVRESSTCILDPVVLDGVARLLLSRIPADQLVSIPELCIDVHIESLEDQQGVKQFFGARPFNDMPTTLLTLWLQQVCTAFCDSLLPGRLYDAQSTGVDRCGIALARLLDLEMPQVLYHLGLCVMNAAAKEKSKYFGREMAIMSGILLGCVLKVALPEDGALVQELALKFLGGDEPAPPRKLTGKALKAKLDAAVSKVEGAARSSADAIAGAAKRGAITIEGVAKRGASKKSSNHGDDDYVYGAPTTTTTTSSSSSASSSSPSTTPTPTTTTTTTTTSTTSTTTTTATTDSPLSPVAKRHNPTSHFEKMREPKGSFDKDLVPVGFTAAQMMNFTYGEIVALRFPDESVIIAELLACPSRVASDAMKVLDVGEEEIAWTDLNNLPLCPSHPPRDLSNRSLYKNWNRLRSLHQQRERFAFAVRPTTGPPPARTGGSPGLSTSREPDGVGTASSNGAIAPVKPPKPKLVPPVGGRKSSRTATSSGSSSPALSAKASTHSSDSSPSNLDALADAMAESLFQDDLSAEEILLYENKSKGSLDDQADASLDEQADALADSVFDDKFTTAEVRLVDLEFISSEKL